MAWYSAAPENKTENRLAAVQKNGGEPVLPDLQESYYLAQILERVGVCSSGFNGPEALTAQELAAWSKATARPLTPWEFQALLDASRAYCGEYYQAKKPERPAPYALKKQHFNPAVISDRIRISMRSRLLSEKKG